MSFSVVRRALAMAGVMLATSAAVGLGVGSPAAAADESMVSVVHGIPGQPVDVYVNGAKTLNNFQPSAVAGPLSLAAGTYDVALTKPGDPVTSAILENKTLAVPGGKNLTLVAHLNAGGTPVLTAFVNDVSMIGAGKTRLVVRHTAAAPAVDVRAGGTAVFTNLTNPNEAKGDIPAGKVDADVVLAGTSTVAIGPATLDLPAGVETIVYAIGSAEGKSLSLVAQTIKGLGAAPSGMPAGSGGQAATSENNTIWYLAGAAGILLLIGTVTYLRRRPAADK